MTISTQPAFIELLKVSLPFYKKIKVVAESNKIDDSIQSNRELIAIRKDLVKYKRNNGKTDISSFYKLLSISEKEYHDYVQDVTKCWDDLREAEPTIVEVPLFEMEEMVSNEIMLDPSNPIIQWIANLTGMDPEDIFNAWIIHLSGEEVEGTPTCKTICDIIAMYKGLRATISHTLSGAACTALVLPAAIAACMALVALSYMTKTNAISRDLENCLEDCRGE